jgi:transposase
MAIVAGFDVHRTQITFDVLDTETGELARGRIESTPAAVCSWVKRFPGQRVEVAVEACTGWLFVCDSLTEAGAIPHLAEPAETSARRGKKRHAKTDRADARHLRELLGEGRLPEAWLPPAHVVEWRTRTRLRKTLVDERTQWLQRIRATLFHHGVPPAEVPERLLGGHGRSFLECVELPEAARERITVALAMIDAIEIQLAPIERRLRRLARRQPGCQALMREPGIGELIAPTLLCELGDVSRLSSSRKAVRAVGLDVGVYRADRRSRVGKLTRQGSPAARWALYEAAQSASLRTSPNHGAYVELKARGLSHTRTTLTIARRLTRRCFHTLRELGPAALAPEPAND